MLTPYKNIHNPVFTAKHVTDIKAEFVADPFMVQEGEHWYLFFEIFNAKTGQGDIGVATSNDLGHWTYRSVVLDEPFHLSYPYVFKSDNAYYMIPESRHANTVRLYKATAFPLQWSFVATLFAGPYVDPSIFPYDGKWWMFVGDNSPVNDTLRLYYAENLTGPWVEHPKSPVRQGNAHIARPGGRVLVLDNRVIRFAQDDAPTYGRQVWAFEIIRLTTTEYAEQPVMEPPILTASGGSAWNGQGMHHVDLHKISGNTWIACVDGVRTVSVLRPGYLLSTRLRQ